MNKYLAKSDPRETIQEHTDKLLENYELLKKLYPDINVNWKLLYISALFHDLGKMNINFQKTINGKKVKDQIPHGILSLAFLDRKKLTKEGFSENEIKIIYHAIAYHHERKLEYTDEFLLEEIKLMQLEAENFNYDKAEDLVCKDNISPKFFRKNERIQMDEDEEMFFEFVMVKGLLNRLDYAASAGIEVENQNNFLLDALKTLNYKWNELQEYMKKNRDKNMAVIAQTGMGKTEAGLLWIGNNKGFFILPLKTAINAIYKRVLEIVITDINIKVGLLHSETYKEYMTREKEGIEDYFNRTKQFSLPLTICTLDQLFDLVFRYPGFEQKLATLSYSKIVIDEIQMYSPDLLAYLIVGLEYINKVGGKFAILTATLPSLLLDLLREQGVDIENPKVFIDNDLKRHSIKTIDDDVDINLILEKYKNNKVLVICNTVKKAQEVYESLKENLNENEINLFHSKFTKEDRQDKEEKIIKFGDKDNKVDKGIWITTQVVEASLDIDFDILITELSDINGLFQRMGRCYRKRSFEEEGYNCFVFTGENIINNSKFLDKGIFNYSKEILEKIDGILTEEEKIKIVEELYSTEKLKDTEYYKKIKKAIKYAKSFDDFELKKSDARERFRDIISWNIIPEKLYSDNKDIIDGLVSIVKDYESFSKEERYESKNKILNYTVSINMFDFKEENIAETIELNRYERIYIYKCDYSYEKGFQKKELEESNIF